MLFFFVGRADSCRWVGQFGHVVLKSSGSRSLGINGSKPGLYVYIPISSKGVKIQTPRFVFGGYGAQISDPWRIQVDIHIYIYVYIYIFMYIYIYIYPLTQVDETSKTIRLASFAQLLVRFFGWLFAMRAKQRRYQT